MSDDFTLSIARDRSLLIAAAGGSLLISIWLLLTNEVINRDGVRYVTAAEALMAGNIQAAFDAFPSLPFHSAIMAGLHMLTGWSLEACGYVLIVPFHLIVVFTFLAILKQLGAKAPVLWGGLVLVLLHPGLNDTLPSILRDQGYWAFWLLSLLWFMRFFKHGRWTQCIAWAMFAIVSMLFRIEGLVFLTCLPLALLAKSPLAWSSRVLLIVKAYAPVLCIVLLAAGYLLLIDRGAGIVEQSRFLEPYHRVQDIWSSMSQGIVSSGEQLGETLLPRYSRSHGTAAMVMVLIYIAAIESLRAVNIVYLAMAVAAGTLRRFTPDRDVLPVLWWAMVINAGLIAGFVLSEHYLSTRYAAGLAFCVMLLASFGLASLWQWHRQQQWTSLKGRLAYPVLIAALLIVGLSGLISIGPRKFHEREAGRWIIEHVSQDTAIFFDDVRTRYYAGRPYTGGVGHDWLRVRWMLQRKRLDEYELLVLHFSRNEEDALAEAVKLVGAAPQQRFENNRGDAIYIFQMPADE